MNKHPTIWGTLEVYCAVADMDYDNDYVPLHSQAFKFPPPLCREAYEFIVKAVHAQMDKDLIDTAERES